MSLRRALRSERGFGVFWLGFGLSVLGDAITRTTLIWYVFELTGSTVSLDWLSFCFTGRDDHRAQAYEGTCVRGIANVGTIHAPHLAW